MGDPLLGKSSQKADETLKLNKHICTACNAPLSPGSIYCSNCGPPQAYPEGEGMTFTQAFLRITILVLVFAVFMVLKLDIEVSEWKIEWPFAGKTIEEVEKPQDKDFKIFYSLKVFNANIRERPSLKGKILSIASKGDRIEVLEEKSNWAKVRVRGKVGWISRKLLSAEIR
ncbi:MAG: SH3 domain-containing protein [Nitrospinota bacterium]|nr:SH3 domain-containing protein [Nitrospinota bacterium]